MVNADCRKRMAKVPLSPWDRAGVRGTARLARLQEALTLSGHRPKVGRERGLARGVTLIELLVVVSIIMILTVVVLPTMQPAAESRRIREAARVVNVFLATARNRAIATGKPCGVVFERTEVDGRFCTVLYQIETPPPYAGDSVNSRITVSGPAAWNNKTVNVTGGDTGLDSAGFIGDVLQLNHQGYCWTISGRNGVMWSFDSTNRPFPPFVPDYAPLPFKIFRQPVKTSAEPLQLPTGVVVDLSCSGSDSEPHWFHEPLDPNSGESIKTVKIVFAPDGSLGRCFWGIDRRRYYRYKTPTEPLYFLIGLSDRPAAPTSVPAAGAPPPEDELPNWIEPTNLWVSISPRTGLIATSENHYVDPTQGVDGLDWNTLSTWPIHDARTYARQSQSMGGR